MRVKKVSTLYYLILRDDEHRKLIGLGIDMYTKLNKCMEGVAFEYDLVDYQDTIVLLSVDDECKFSYSTILEAFKRYLHNS